MAAFKNDLVRRIHHDTDYYSLLFFFFSLGSGGLMLVHDIRNNKSRVIDFRETAPSAIQEEMLQQNLEEKVKAKALLDWLHKLNLKWTVNKKKI